MKFSEAWLREWVNPDITTEQLADQLSMAGLEVDSVEPAAPPFTGVVVGEVLTREHHPDADKLSVCAVNIGGDAPSQIVCGAKNVAAGMKVPVATVGARLSNDFKIKRAKLRGVESLGMICSASELGLAESSDGILPLPADAPVGKDLRDYMALDDQCIDVDLTPDRADCLSVAGIAREVGVLNKAPLTPPTIDPVPAAIDDEFAVSLDAPEACPRYLCRIVRGIDATAATPGWMVEKLRRGGLRAISPVVDVTNYVLLELGQPMHGFDLGKLDGGIRVRMAEAGETLTLLDGSEAKLRADTLVIADHARALAMAGIMGGEGSRGDRRDQRRAARGALSSRRWRSPARRAAMACTPIRRTASSAASTPGCSARRWSAPRRCCSRSSAASPVRSPRSRPRLRCRSAKPITLRRARVTRLLGVEIDDADHRRHSRAPGHAGRRDAEGWQVTAPSARFDIAIEADLIEEIGRIYGYANIPASLSSAPVSIAVRPEAEFSLDKRQAAAGPSRLPGGDHLQFYRARDRRRAHAGRRADQAGQPDLGRHVRHAREYLARPDPDAEL